MTLGRRVAIDVGKVRIGVAASDLHGILASPLTTVRRGEDIAEAVTATVRALKEIEPIEIYVGLPINLSGKETASTHDALDFARALDAVVDAPVLMVDERLSTVAAASALRSSGKNSREARGVVDQIAATVILETVLATVKNGTGSAGRAIGAFDV